VATGHTVESPSPPISASGSLALERRRRPLLGHAVSARLEQPPESAKPPAPRPDRWIAPRLMIVDGSSAPTTRSDTPPDRGRRARYQTFDHAFETVSADSRWHRSGRNRLLLAPANVKSRPSPPYPARPRKMPSATHTTGLFRPSASTSTVNLCQGGHANAGQDGALTRSSTGGDHVPGSSGPSDRGPRGVSSPLVIGVII
jgi:hypothetical protein